MTRLHNHRTGRDSMLWPVLLLLLIVLVPSAGVVWMMRAAMENERLAVRQRLAEAYRTQLEIAHRRIDEQWQSELRQLDEIANRDPPPEAFAEIVSRMAVDSVVILDEDGQVAYPSAASSSSVIPESNSGWQAAEYLENSQRDPAAAAAAYRQIAAETADAALAIRARQAEARALARAGDRAGAIQVLQQLSADQDAVDFQGRSIAADAQLRLLELLDRDSAEWNGVAESLAARLNSYEGPLLPSDQRRFLMHALHALTPNLKLTTLTAEELAAQFLQVPLDASSRDVLNPTRVSGLAQFPSPTDRAIALVRDRSITQLLDRVLAQQPFPEGVVVEARGPTQSDGTTDELVAVSLAPALPGWRLALKLADVTSFDAAADARLAFFLWTGIVVVAITVALALLVARTLRAQSRLARLKNDLVATVSHELKTPLASIRLLVDTLLSADGSADAPFGDQQRAREYLELIAKENSRLTRLIDNFLTFSRMERGKHRFDFQPIDAAEIVDQSVAAVAERFDGSTNTLSVDVERLLSLDGDVDALVTVVVNLLDNAWKYSDEPKHVRVVARQLAEQVVISVSDNGIGLPPRALRKVFDRFYQVDQRLSRSHDGCGLGLSIVKFIVEAHGGSVAVESLLGAGATFTVTLPANRAARTSPTRRAEPAEVPQ